MNQLAQQQVVWGFPFSILPTPRGLVPNRRQTTTGDVSPGWLAGAALQPVREGGSSRGMRDVSSRSDTAIGPIITGAGM